jgi:type IV secretory pathway TrbD component
VPFNEKGEFIRTRRSAAQSCDSTELSRDDLLTVAKGFGALVLLAGLIWFVVAFHEWIAIGLGLWLVSSLRAWPQ